jgi:hypothetical protein
MKAHTEEARQFGINGRRIAESQFDRTVVLDMITTHLERQVMTRESVR